MAEKALSAAIPIDRENNCSEGGSPEVRLMAKNQLRIDLQILLSEIIKFTTSTGLAWTWHGQMKDPAKVLYDAGFLKKAKTGQIYCRQLDIENWIGEHAMSIYNILREGDQK